MKPVGISGRRPHVKARHIRLHSISWWIWAVLACLLAAGSLGLGHAWQTAFAVSAANALAALARSRSLHHFPTQVRLVYALWMAVALVTGIQPMLWIQALGTASLVIFGYCPLARSLMLLPRNRTAPLSLQAVKKIVLSPPTTGVFRDEAGL